MSDLRGFIVQNRLPFSEGAESPEVYYILVNKRCVALCLPYKDQQLVPTGDREIKIIRHFARVSDVPGFVSV